MIQLSIADQGMFLYSLERIIIQQQRQHIGMSLLKRALLGQQEIPGQRGQLEILALQALPDQPERLARRPDRRGRQGLQALLALPDQQAQPEVLARLVHKGQQELWVQPGLQALRALRELLRQLQGLLALRDLLDQLGQLVRTQQSQGHRDRQAQPERLARQDQQARREPQARQAQAEPFRQ